MCLLYQKIKRLYLLIIFFNQYLTNLIILFFINFHRQFTYLVNFIPAGRLREQAEHSGDSKSTPCYFIINSIISGTAKNLKGSILQPSPFVVMIIDLLFLFIFLTYFCPYSDPVKGEYIPNIVI